MEDSNEINRTLGAILGEVKGMNRRFDEIDERDNEQDEQIKDLNAFKDNITGRFTVIAAVFAIVCTIIGSWINHTFFR